MAIYLVDYENVKDLSGIKDLSAGETVVIFYSSNSDSLTFEQHQELSSTKAKVEYKCVDVQGMGKNALDFQLCTYLGFIAGKNENNENEIYVLAKDKGYLNASALLKNEKSINVHVIESISNKKEIVVVKGEKAAPTGEKAAPKVSSGKQTEIEKCLQGLKLDKNERKKVIEIAKRCQDRKQISNELNQLFKDSKKTGEVMKAIKKIKK